MVKIEEERRRAGGLQQRHRLAPVIALGLAQRKAVERAETRHVGAGDQRATNQIALVAGKLAPEGGLEIGILADRDRASVGDCSGAGGSGIVEPGEIALAHQHGEVMIAETNRAIAQRVAR